MYEFKKKAINPAAFDQTTNWYDKFGKPYAIADMNYRHVTNTIKYLSEHYHEMVIKNPPLLQALAKRQAEARAEYEAV